MGQLVEGVWRDEWYDTSRSDGAFERPPTRFRHAIGGPDSRYPAAAGRYHLFVSLACPWAHRTLIFRKLKRLEGLITVSIVEPLMLEHGWSFGAAGDPLTGALFLHEVYTRAEPRYTGRVTVPVLWDKATSTVVNNESAEIIRILNSAFAALAEQSTDFYPADLAGEIDALNTRIYERINNGVYRAGFATTQPAYEEAVTALFAELDAIESRLATRRYLCGERLTEADWRLFTTLIRFDAVYHGHFKCNLRQLREYPILSGFARELYQMPGIAETVDFTHIKRHYYGSHRKINPTGIVPVGPRLDFAAPTRRAVPRLG